MNQKIQEYSQLLSTFKKTGLIKECFHHNKEQCAGKIKQSHSIQRNGRLSIIEGNVNGNMSVYSFSSAIANEKTPIADLKPIGKKEASTFFGFCDYHDTVLFSEIENNPFNNSDKHLFLHSYRSYAHSYHRKYEEQKAYNDKDSKFVKMLPSYYVEYMKEGISLGLEDNKKRKKQLDTYLENQDYDALEYLVYKKEGLYPFAVSSIMSPKVSYYNKPMNNHIDPKQHFSIPIITFLPNVDITFVVLAAFPDDLKAINLLDELDDLNDLQLEKAITSLIIANCENAFFSPSFWNGLTKAEKRALLKEFEINTLNPTYHNKFFNSNFNFFDNKYSVKEKQILGEK